jgi:uncharacterized protein (TIGR01777 family)
MKTLITGATGFLGQNLVKSLSSFTALSRTPDRARATLGLGGEILPWNPTTEPAPAAAFEGIDTVVHLAGENVGEGRWTEKKKRRIRESRTLGTRNLIEGIANSLHRPRTLISASAIGIYGDRSDEHLDERSSWNSGFLATVCSEWEREAGFAEDLGIRTVFLRFGILLGREGGALPKMMTPFKWFVGGRLGSGDQFMSWIHVQDAVRAIRWVASNPGIRGPVNVVAPTASTNREFTTALAGSLRRPALFPVPGFALRLAAGEFANELLASQRVVPQALLDRGFNWEFPVLRDALDNLIRPTEVAGQPVEQMA